MSGDHNAHQKPRSYLDRDTIIRLAHAANFEGFGNGDWVCTTEEIERFAALVIANNPPQSWMSYQEGYEAGKLAEREYIRKQIAMLHDSLSLTGTANWGRT